MTGASPSTRVRALAGPVGPPVVRDVTGVGAAQTLPCPCTGTVACHVTEGEVRGEGQDLARGSDQSLSVSFAARWEGSLGDKVSNLQLFVLHACRAEAKVCELEVPCNRSGQTKLSERQQANLCGREACCLA